MKDVVQIADGGMLVASSIGLFEAMLIRDYRDLVAPELVKERIAFLWDKLYKKHKITTTQYDKPYLAMLVVSGRDQERLLEESEACYDRLTKVLKKSYGARCMCHVLSFDSRPTEMKCNHVMELYEAFTKRGVTVYYDNYITLACLHTLGLEVEPLVSTVIETMQYLKSQDVFQSAWSFFERDQLLYASALVIDECTRSQNLTIVQQMMFVAAILSKDINDY